MVTVSLLAKYLCRESNYEHYRHAILSSVAQLGISRGKG
jgi:hypothetical protein